MNVYKLGPDLGDCIAALCVCRHLGRGHMRLFNTPGTKGFSEESYSAIKSLIEIQDYCESITWFNEEENLEVSHDFTGFRVNWGSHSTLIGKQAYHVGVDPNQVSTKPWLNVAPYDKHNKIVVCRSTRNKGLLTWFRLWQTKARECIFLGVKEDYDQFCVDNCPWPQADNLWHRQAHRVDIPFHKTQNLLEATKMIMGGRLFVVNQTALLWCAYGAGFGPIFIEQTTADSYLPDHGRRYIRNVEDNPSVKDFMHL